MMECSCSLFAFYRKGPLRVVDLGLVGYAISIFMMRINSVLRSSPVVREERRHSGECDAAKKVSRLKKKRNVVACYLDWTAVVHQSLQVSNLHELGNKVISCGELPFPAP